MSTPMTARPVTRSVEFHAVMVAAITTGAVLTLSASDLGPLAPMLIALGLSAVLFGLLGEAILGLTVFVVWLREHDDQQGEEYL
jgi:hypothetical protein